MISRREFLRTSSIAAGGLIAGYGPGQRASGGAARNRKRPNIVFLMADDHRAFSMGCVGDTHIKTPHLDALAAKGVRFENCYATSPLCMAARATVFTGMYEYKTGCNFQTGKLSASDWNGLAYPILLKKAGYRTAFAGKWGFPLDEPGYAGQFDKWGGFEGSGQGSYVTGKNPSMKPYAEKYPHVTRALGAFGRDFVRESAKTEKPFCLSLSFKAPHKPHDDIDPEDQKLYKDGNLPKPKNWGPKYLDKLPVQAKLGRQYVQRSEWDAEHYDEHMKQYYRLISGVDSAVGMVLEELDRQGVADNTVIIYTSDNGYFCGAHGLQGKVLPYDDASLIPLIVYDPRVHSGKKSSIVPAVAGNIDFAPTILDLAGLKIPEKMDGKSLMPIVEDTGRDVRDSLLVIQNWDWLDSDHTKGLAVLTKDYKYVNWCYGDENLVPAEELFDLRKDPYETKDLAKNPKLKPVLERMRKLYDKHHRHWSENCVDAEDYTRHRAIFNRNVPWREKRYRTYPEKARGAANVTRQNYEDFTGHKPPQGEGK